MLIFVAHLVLLGAALLAWLQFAYSPSGQSVGAAAAHGLVVMFLGAAVLLQGLATTTFLVRAAGRRRLTWGRLVAVHVVTLPAVLLTIVAGAWVYEFIDDRVLPHVPGTNAYQRLHAEQRLLACRPPTPPKILLLADGQAMIALEFLKTVDENLFIEEAVLGGSEETSRFELARSGRRPFFRLDRSEERVRLWAIMQPVRRELPGTTARVVLHCNDGTLVLDGTRRTQDYRQTGNIGWLTLPLQPVEERPATPQEEAVYVSLRGLGRPGPAAAPRGPRPGLIRAPAQEVATPQQERSPP